MDSNFKGTATNALKNKAHTWIRILTISSVKCWFVTLMVSVLKTSKIKTTDEQQAARPILAYSSLGSRLQGVGVNTHVDNELPQFVSDIVGKTFIFQLKGAQHDPDDWIPVQNPIASKVSAGTSSTVVEKTDGVAAELGENTNVNHQTFSSGVPGGRSASNNQIVDPKNGKKKARLD